PDQIEGGLLRHAPRCVLLNALPRCRLQSRACLLDPLSGDSGWRRIGVGIHPIRTRKYALKSRKAADQSLSGLLGHTHRGIAKAQPDFLGCGAAVPLGAKDNKVVVVLS